MRIFSRSIVAVALLGPIALAVPARTEAVVTPCTPPSATAPAAVDVPTSGFVGVAPIRLADTRTGVNVAASPIGAGCVLRVPVAPADPPSGVVGVAMTVTTDRATDPGFITAFACGTSRPDTSVLNQRPNDATPNLVVLPVDSTRELCFFADHETDLLVDVTGWFTPTGDPFHEVTPTRVLDTRDGTGIGAIGKVTTTEIPLTMPSSVPAEAVAVAATVTITQPDATTFATAYPCGTTPPATSTTNALAGRDRGAPALVALGDDHRLCVRASSSTHLLVDVTGWYGPETGPTDPEVGSALEFLTTSRIADSRNGVTWPKAPLAANSVTHLGLLPFTPVGTTAVQLDVIATGADAAGYLTVYPCSATLPVTSAVNYTKGATESAMVTVAVSDLADVCVFTSARTHVVVDLFASYGAPGSLHALVAAPNAVDQGVNAGQVDHTVHCPANGQLTITVDAAPGVVASVDGGPVALGSQQVTKTGLTPDALVRIDLSGIVTETHYLRCLPADFPALRATGKATTPGWYPTSTLGPTYAFILDQYGVPVWYKKTSNPVIGTWPLSGGKLAWRIWTGGGFPGGNGNSEPTPLGFQIHDLTGAQIGSVNPVGGTERLDWHDLLELPNGGHTVITYPTRNTGVGRSCTKATGGTTTTTWVVDSDVVELDAAGNETWRWRSQDHTDIGENMIPVCFDVSGTWMLDYMHLNSVERLADGDYVVSARHFNSIERIDHVTKAVEWKLGGTTPHEGTLLTMLDANGATAGAGARPVGPHDARVLANGNVTVHDNHVGGAPRASEYAVDTVAGTARLVSQIISENPFGGTLGSMRRQADGATVIGWGEGTNPWLQEVDPSGATTLRVGLPSGVLSYRVVKVPEATYDRATLRAQAGGPAV